MTVPSVPQMLEELRNGPFAGRGGARALAKALGVTKLTIFQWRHERFQPTYEHRMALIGLYKAAMQK